ncbi:unnamed protein product [Rotaria magnacalcarata]|uniref:Uncharacterized protein n=2 Tax=Rotaria magnacalcarata TaxID=392030 RepID=A0A816QPD4_9BILA|nr:unnamed protein product [Rotaria magnacalcarata]CAF5176303.1 unnamed protein product [Rotaria magnacalcarata]
MPIRFGSARLKVLKIKIDSAQFGWQIFRFSSVRLRKNLNRSHLCSVYDPNRIQNMTAILSRTFAAEYKESDTERIIKYFNSHDSIQLFSSITADMALAQLDQSLHLNLYQCRCPICLYMLDADMADVLSVQVYTLKGTTHKGQQNNTLERCY